VRKLIFLLMLGTAFPAKAQDWQSDAFGLYRGGSDRQRDRWAGLNIGSTDETTRLVAPGPVNKLYFIAGPKSQPAGKDRVHLVALGYDEDGNMIADGIGVNMSTGDGSRISRTVQSGIADLLYDPDDRAALYTAGAASGGVQSAGASYRVVPDISTMLPVLEGSEEVLVERFFNLQTKPLIDAFGNTTDDGIGLAVWLKDSIGHWSRADAVTSGGVARSRLLSRAMSGRVRGQMSLAANLSTPESIEILKLRPAGMLNTQMQILSDIDAARLMIGPFTTDAGHLLNDGAGVRIAIISQSGHRQEFDTWVRDGMAELLLAESSRDLPTNIEINSTLGLQTSTPRVVVQLPSTQGIRE